MSTYQEPLPKELAKYKVPLIRYHEEFNLGDRVKVNEEIQLPTGHKITGIEGRILTTHSNAPKGFRSIWIDWDECPIQGVQPQMMPNPLNLPEHSLKKIRRRPLTRAQKRMLVAGMQCILVLVFSASVCNSAPKKATKNSKHVIKMTAKHTHTKTTKMVHNHKASKRIDAELLEGHATPPAFMNQNNGN